jgi:hypothetical protein
MYIDDCTHHWLRPDHSQYTDSKSDQNILDKQLLRGRVQFHQILPHNFGGWVRTSQSLLFVILPNKITVQLLKVPRNPFGLGPDHHLRLPERYRVGFDVLPKGTELSLWKSLHFQPGRPLRDWVIHIFMR